MIHWLIYVGLAVVSFMWVDGQVDPARQPKMAWAAAFALCIGLYAIWKGKLKAFPNKYVPILVLYIFVAYYLSPSAKILYFGINSARFWSWQPMFYAVAFFLFLMTISSIHFSKRKIDRLFTAMVWCGVVMAGLVFFQSLHLMQFFEHRFGTYGNMGGTLGNPTLVAPYLGIIIPIALYKKKYIMAGLMIYSLIATCSNVGLAGLIVSMSFYFATKSKKLFIAISITLAVATTLIITAFATSQRVREFIPDNQRFVMAKYAMQDLTNPVMKDSNGEKSKKIYTITGLGFGSYKYLFHAFHNNTYTHAHNEYVQTIYEIGIIGFLIFLASILNVFSLNFSIHRIFKREETRYKRALMSSFICSCVCAGGIFIWQFGTTIFFTLVIVGLLHNSYNDKYNIGE